MRRAPRSTLCLALAACGDAATVGPSRLDVTPSTIDCVAGDLVPLTATLDGGARAPITFSVTGSAAWLVAVERDRGTASLRCEAAGRDVLDVEAAGQRVLVPVAVQPPPAGSLRVELTPSALTVVNGFTTVVDARAVSTRAGVTADVRFSSSDTLVAVVDSVFGVVRATLPGTTTITAAARADRRVRETVAVTVTRSSLLVTSMGINPAIISLAVGDSTRIVPNVRLASTAPPGTSRDATYTSDDPDVAVVSATGVVRGVGQGITTITVAAAAAPLQRLRASVTVRQPAP